jgi:hypothetical protein
MEDNHNFPAIMAVHPLKKALSYLLFSIFALLASIGIIFLFTTDLSKYLNLQFLQSESRMDQSMALIVGLVLLLGSLLSLHMAWKNFCIAHKLEKDGNLTDGLITNKWADTFERRVLYHVSYRFQDDLEVWETISKHLYRKLNKGYKVPIRYLKDNPSISRLDHEQISA